MIDAHSFLAQVDTLRRRTLSTLEDLVEKANQYDLPKPPEILDTYRQKLAASHYTILVVGEVSRGKSSFVNALIGRDLLPMHASVTTKQVFRVTHARREAYRLRFEDGTSLPIKEGELERYGSQTETDQQGTSHVNLDLLKWIEVDAPCHFLPANISLLDTPGLGSLYAPHSEITQRFIPHADAVIFVLDSRSEMGQMEKDFIKTLLEFTHHIFFIQTHIDLYDEVTWRNVQRKNESILQEQFRGRLNDTRVWPISNTNMMSATQPDEDEGFYRNISRQEELLPALEAFLFTAAGWGRCVDALKAASSYLIDIRKILIGRLAALVVGPEQERQEVKQSEERWQQFNSEWGTQGQRRRELQSTVRRIVSSNRQSMIRLLRVGAGIEQTQRDKINSLTSTEEADRLAKVMSEQVITEVVGRWRSVGTQANQQCAALLRPLESDADALLPQTDDPNLVARLRLRTAPSDELLECIAEFPYTFLNNWQAASLLFLVAAPFIPITGHVLLAGAAIAGIWGFARRIRFVKATHLAEAQQKLHNDLSDLMREVRDRFQQPDSLYDDKSLINHYFDALTSRVNELIENFVEQKRAETQSERSRMVEMSKLNEQQRAAEEFVLREHVEAWEELERIIKASLAELKALKQS